MEGSKNSYRMLGVSIGKAQKALSLINHTLSLLLLALLHCSSISASSNYDCPLIPTYNKAVLTTFSLNSCT